MLENFKTNEEVFHRLDEINETIKTLAEEKAQLMDEFFNKYGDFEFPVTVEDKLKYFRVYEVEGRFVYNTKYDVGLRMKPVKIFGEVK